MQFNILAKKILDLPRFAKRGIALSLDSCLCILAVWFAFYLRLGTWVPLGTIPTEAIVLSLIFAIPLFNFFGMYRAIFRYSGWPALMTVGKAATLYGVAYFTVFTAFGIDGVPRTVGIIQPAALFLFVGTLRVFARFWLGGSHGRSQSNVAGSSRVLIYGAGFAGRQLAAAMRTSNQLRVVGYLDDDKNLHGGVLNGLSIFNPNELNYLVNSLQVTDVLLAIPSAGRSRRNQILELIAKMKVNIRTLPNLSDLAEGKITASDIRELDIEDLLGRNPMQPRVDLLRKNIFNEVVMVTGAGGSIGSELCRQILKNEPSTLILFEQSEFALYRIEQQLLKLMESLPPREVKLNVPLIKILGSVQDPILVRDVLKKYSPKTLFHAAAYKHVPLVEENFVQGIRNNIFGTQTLALAAVKSQVSNFVLVSTDKAVRPTNIMGATKRVAELVLQTLAASNSATIFSMVRFGNVLDSSGSVVPLFRRQIKDGGPITLTHSEITRYFMTIPEAASLVIQAGAMAKGGEVFVLDMGEPVKIINLARHMIELSGLEERTQENPEGDIEIHISGLRPGEKLYEELLIGDNPTTTEHPLVMKAQEEFLSHDVLKQKLDHLNSNIDQLSSKEAKKLLQDLVPGYRPSDH